MSQVIVTVDPLQPERDKTRAQEHRIDREGQFEKWRRSDVTGPDLAARVVGLAVLPILALWGLLAAIIAATFAVVNCLFKALGQIFGGRKDLIRK